MADNTNTTLILVRHGETQWNAAGRIQGQCDSPLTDTGHAQAQAVATRLAGSGCTHLFHSDLGRTRATAAAIAAATGLAPKIEYGLRERAFGLFEGFTRARLNERYPELFKRYAAREPGFAIPGGESLEQLSQRVTHCVEKLAAEALGGNLILVSHGGVLDALYRYFAGMALEQPRTFSLTNTAYNAAQRSSGSWRIICWGCTEHLVSVDA